MTRLLEPGEDRLGHIILPLALPAGLFGQKMLPCCLRTHTTLPPTLPGLFVQCRFEFVSSLRSGELGGTLHKLRCIPSG